MIILSRDLMPVTANNITHLLPHQRAREAWHQITIYHALLKQIEDAQCDCDDLFGVPSDSIAATCLILLTDELFSFDDPRNLAFLAIASDLADENLASFMAAICTDYEKAHHGGHSSFDREMAAEPFMG